MKIGITDPAFQNLEKNKLYDLCGLINSQHEIAQCAFNTGIIFRMALRPGLKISLIGNFIDWNSMISSKQYVFHVDYGSRLQICRLYL